MTDPCPVLHPVSRRQWALMNGHPAVILECLGKKHIGLGGGWDWERSP